MEIKDLPEQEKKEFFKLLMGLSPREKECFVMHKVELQTFRQISEELNVSRSTVQKYVERARRKINGLTG